MSDTTSANNATGITCLKCGMVGSVDPTIHYNRFGHWPVMPSSYPGKLTVNEVVVAELNNLVRMSGSPIAAQLRLVYNGVVSGLSDEVYRVIRGDLDMYGRVVVVLERASLDGYVTRDIWEPFDMVAIDPGRAHDIIGACTAPHVFGCPDGQH